MDNFFKWVNQYLPFVDDEWTWKPKDWLDQLAHALAGYAIALLIFIFTGSLLAAVAVSFFVGALREWKQKPDRRVWFNKDSAFWFGGALLITLLH